MATPKGNAKSGPKFTTRITTRSGKVIYAKDYGLKAFPIGRR